MKLQSKFMGFVVAVCIGIGFVGCGKGSNALSCESDKMKKALEKHRYIKELKSIRSNVKLSEFREQYMGTLGAYMDIEENMFYCECTVESKLNSRNYTETLTFTAERFKGGGIAFYDFFLY